ncbi:tetratricopeptide repeat protein, partial [Paracoccaceae bacterium]|nr:tetratricopeptide repeat protein [Paracoccaceae bacterium]
AAYMGLKNTEKTIASYQKALQLNPNHTDAYNNMGMALYDQGRFDEAVESYQKAVKLEPDFADAHYNLGNALKQTGDLKQAIESYKTSLTINPSDAEVLFNYGNALKNYGEFDQAIEVYAKVLKLNPQFTAAKINMDNANKDKITRANSIKKPSILNNSIPKTSIKLYKMAIQLYEQGSLQKALDYLENAIEICPQFAEAYSLMGLIFLGNDTPEAAIDSYKKAIRINPYYADAYNNWGNALLNQGDANEAIKKYKKAIKLKPYYAEAYFNLGNALRNSDNLNTAISNYRKAIEIKSDFFNAFTNLGHSLGDIGDLEGAIQSYRKALQIKPEDAQIRIDKLHQQGLACDWVSLSRENRFIAKVGVSGHIVHPFPCLSLEDAPARHKLRSENYAKNIILQKSMKCHFWLLERAKRLRLGYFSSDFKNHPVSRLMAKVFELHDRNRFEVFGYSIKQNDDDYMQQRLRKAFDQFIDISSMSDEDIVALVRRDGIDIAIDLNGYTNHNRVSVFAHRVAPIQINYLGYPGTMGADFIDYIIADQNLIPVGCQKYYSEKPIYLPHQFQAQDDTLRICDITPSRSELGLPEKGFVFCAINNTYKIKPPEFNIWMHLLQRVEESVLWLLEANEVVKNNLIQFAKSKGIPEYKLVFAKHTTHEKYLAQFMNADLYLDTFIYNAGATASNALWAGLPVITKVGKGYTARMAGSLLAALGLPELITSTEKEYANLALQLAENPKMMAVIKQKLKTNLRTMPLFKTNIFTKNLETGYQMAYDRCLEGKKPDVIYVLDK